MMWTIAALLASPAMAHLAAPADPARTHRHATILSEACAARNSDLMQDGGGAVCVTDPESTQGPYGWPTTAIRADMRDDESCAGLDGNAAYCAGTEFTFDVELVNSTTCETIEGAAIEVWHCSWDGLYSHYLERSQGGMNNSATDETSFLRAVQFTNEEGVATFTTAFPGWYLGRTWHIHVRVHFDITEDADGQGYTGGTVSHIGQLYVTDDVITTFMAVEPYSTSTIPYTNLRDDGIFVGQGDDFGLMTIAANDGSDITQGLRGSITVAVLEEEREEPVGGPGGPGGPNGGGPPPNGGDNSEDTSNTSSAGIVSVSSMALIVTAFVTTYAF